MSRLFFLLLLFTFNLLASLVFTSPAYAAFRMLSPGPVYNDNKTVSITVEATESDTFAVGVPYYFSALDSFDPGKRTLRCNSGGQARTNDPKRITAVLDLESVRSFTSCRDLTGTWNFKLYLDDRNKPMAEGDFLIEQAGGGIPSIVPYQSPMRVLGPTPSDPNPSIKMILRGVNPQNGYSVWWDGDPSFPNQARVDISQDEIYRRAHAGSGIYEFNLGPGEILIPPMPGKDRFTKPGKHKICMVVGTYAHKDGLACKYSTEVQFTTEDQPVPAPVPAAELRVENDPVYQGSQVLISWNNIFNLTAESKLFLYKASADHNSPQPGSLSLTSCYTPPFPYNGQCIFSISDTEEGLYNFRIFVNNNKSFLTAKSQDFHIQKLPDNVPPPSFSPIPRPSASYVAKASTVSGGQPCDTGDNRGSAVRTAIGCVHTDPPELIKDFLAFGTGISGGLAFLMMLLGAFQMLTSAGNPETLNAGRDRLTNAVIGLLFIIFAVLLLQIIGVDILQIPGFKK